MNRRYFQIMLGIGMLLVGVGSIASEGSPLGILAGLGGFFLLARQFEESRNNREREAQADREYEEWRRSRSPEYDFGGVSDRVDRKPTTNADRVYAHALEAVQNAGLDASTTAVLPVDIGMLAIRGEEPPQLFRTRDVPDDIDYVQPFVQLRLPQRAMGSITFELLDDHGQTVFLHTEEHDLSRGRNLVVPARRIPVHDALDMDEGEWTLKVSADNVLLAVHGFGWRAPDDNIVAEYLEDDGEISNELRAAMAESRLEQMSLDDLLSFQDEPAQRGSSGAL
ncbi:MAG: hypothetical protein AAF787_21485 [Chloroflexota bacterium]